MDPQQLLPRQEPSAQLGACAFGFAWAKRDEEADPRPHDSQISPALTVLTKLIYSLDDEVLIDACWAISYLSDGSSDKIQAVIESGVVRRLVDLLMFVPCKPYQRAPR